VLDQCAASCAEHHDTVASTPSCHHVTSTASHIGHVPSPCGHDHNGTVVTSAKSSVTMGRSIDSLVAAIALSVPVAPIASQWRGLEQSPPGVRFTLDERSLPLRI